MKIPYQFLDTPFAQLLVARCEDKLCFAGFTSSLTALQQTFPQATLIKSEVVLPEGYTALFKPYNFKEFYLQGTAFQKAVWQALLALKPGEQQSYSDIASAIGAPKAVRAVGSAIGKNPICLAIPCHRVISKQGGLGGYSWGTQIKRALLDYERDTFKS